MQLSAQQFARIAEQLEVDDCQGVAGHEKRRAARAPLKQRATIVPYVAGVAAEPVGVEVRDFSSRGIRFLHSARLARGEQFVLQLAQRAGGPVTILCTVVHCRVTSEGPFSTGAEFTCVLRKEKRTTAKTGSLQRAAAAAPPGERERIRRSILD
jgi:hypothetical protein